MVLLYGRFLTPVTSVTLFNCFPFVKKTWLSTAVSLLFSKRHSYRNNAFFLNSKGAKGLRSVSDHNQTHIYVLYRGSFYSLCRFVRTVIYMQCIEFLREERSNTLRTKLEPLTSLQTHKIYTCIYVIYISMPYDIQHTVQHWIFDNRLSVNTGQPSLLIQIKFSINLAPLLLVLSNTRTIQHIFSAPCYIGFGIWG